MPNEATLVSIVQGAEAGCYYLIHICKQYTNRHRNSGFSQSAYCREVL